MPIFISMRGRADRARRARWGGAVEFASAAGKHSQPIFVICGTGIDMNFARPARELRNCAGNIATWADR